MHNIFCQAHYYAQLFLAMYIVRESFVAYAHCGPDFFFADADWVQIFPDFFVIMAVTSARYF